MYKYIIVYTISGNDAARDAFVQAIEKRFGIENINKTIDQSTIGIKVCNLLPSEMTEVLKKIKTDNNITGVIKYIYNEAGRQVGYVRLSKVN